MNLKDFQERPADVNLNKAGSRGLDDAALWVRGKTGTVVGYVADAPDGIPDTVKDIIHAAFKETLGGLPDDVNGADAIRSLMDGVEAALAHINRTELATSRPSMYSTCLSCVYRNAEGLYAGGVGDTSVLVRQKDGTFLRITDPESNDQHGQRISQMLVSSNSATTELRVGKMVMPYPADAVRVLQADAVALCLFSDGVEKHVQHFEAMIASLHEGEQVDSHLLVKAGLPAHSAQLLDDVCVLHCWLPPLPVLADEMPFEAPKESPPSDAMPTRVEDAPQTPSIPMAQSELEEVMETAPKDGGTAETEASKLRLELEALRKRVTELEAVALHDGRLEATGETAQAWRPDDWKRILATVTDTRTLRGVKLIKRLVVREFAVIRSEHAREMQALHAFIVQEAPDDKKLESKDTGTNLREMLRHHRRWRFWIDVVTLLMLGAVFLVVVLLLIDRFFPLQR